MPSPLSRTELAEVRKQIWAQGASWGEERESGLGFQKLSIRDFLTRTIVRVGRYLSHWSCKVSPPANKSILTDDEDNSVVIPLARRSKRYNPPAIDVKPFILAIPG
ncbi:hypothetical protein TNCV_2410381 [Trichonephila clavipes]|nr:hypothetical protein TNCV_2410381 [Trichonephila clavipes]